MIKDTWILSLFLGECTGLFLILGVGAIALRIVWDWDMLSTGRLQLALERQCYLVSTIVMYVFSFELLSVWLFVLIINDHLPPMIKGAMCGAGSLNSNEYGWPTLYLAISQAVFLALWLVLHHVDRKFPEYPLVREKMIGVVLLTPLLIATTTVQILYFSGINPNIITTCCSISFDYLNGNRVAEVIASLLPESELVLAFYATCAIALVSDLFVIFPKGRYGAIGYVLSPFNGIAQCAFSALALVYHYAKYIYGMPGHHCPFDMLWGEYYYIGYGIDALMFISLVTSLSVGILGVVSRKGAIKDEAHRFAQKVATWNAISITTLILVLAGIEKAWDLALKP